MTIARGPRSTAPSGRARANAHTRRRHLTRASAWLAATGIALVGTVSPSPAAAAATVTTPEALFRYAAANVISGSMEAPVEIAAALEAAARLAPPTRGVGAVRAMAVDPEYIAFDAHEDPLGDTELQPELTGASMAVVPGERDHVYFHGSTSGMPDPADLAIVEIAADGDDWADFFTMSPTAKFAPETSYLTHVFAQPKDGQAPIDTGYWAGWRYTAGGYTVVMDRSALKLSAARFTFGVMDGQVQDDGSQAFDLAPDVFTGDPVSLPVLPPSSPVSVKASAGNASTVVSWVAPAATGGAAAIGYKVTSTPGSRTCTTTGKTSCTVTGLSNGTAYTFKVSAVNSVGSSAPSVASASVTPRLPVRISVGKAGYGNVLAVNVDPNKSSSASYLFQVQKKDSAGRWATVRSYATEGTGETRNVTLGAGTFRAYVPASGAYGSAVSPEVRLTAPTVRVAVGRDAAKSKVIVNVDPNKGSGYWKFKLQMLRSNGTWATLSTSYKTSGSGETRTIDKSKGTYRVVVAGKYGYLGAVSGPVTLVK